MLRLSTEFMLWQWQLCAFSPRLPCPAVSVFAKFAYLLEKFHVSPLHEPFFVCLWPCDRLSLAKLLHSNMLFRFMNFYYKTSVIPAENQVEYKLISGNYKMRSHSCDFLTYVRFSPSERIFHFVSSSFASSFLCLFRTFISFPSPCHIRYPFPQSVPQISIPLLLLSSLSLSLRIGALQLSPEFLIHSFCLHLKSSFLSPFHPPSPCSITYEGITTLPWSPCLLWAHTCTCTGSHNYE
jgi:hypothetical protein